MTGIGPVPVTVPRIRDRKPGADEKITFTPSILPRYLRKAKSVEEAAPVALPERPVFGRFQRGAGGAAGAERQGLVGHDDHAAESGLVV